MVQDNFDKMQFCQQKKSGKPDNCVARGGKKIKKTSKRQRVACMINHLSQ